MIDTRGCETAPCVADEPNGRRAYHPPQYEHYGGERVRMEPSVEQRVDTLSEAVAALREEVRNLKAELLDLENFARRGKFAHASDVDGVTNA